MNQLLTAEQKLAKKAYNAAYYVSNLAAILKQKSEYNQTHKAERAVYDAANREHQNRYAVEHRALNPEHERELAKARRRKNPELVRSKARVQYARNPKRVLDLNRAWGIANPDAIRTKHVNRRARVLGAVGSHTAAQWLDKRSLFAHLCAYCGEDKPLTRDHKIPLSRGGSNYIENIIPACRSCNSSKQALTATEFIARRLAQMVA